MRAQRLREGTWFHGSKSLIRDFNDGAPREGTHFGSRDQALMRSCGYLHEVALLCQSPKRVRDRQSWQKTAAAARSRGYDALIYLNRWEGLSADRVMTLSCNGDLDRIDHLGDAKFRALVPEAEDSVLVLYPDIILLRRVWDRSGDLLWERETIKASTPWEDPCVSP